MESVRTGGDTGGQKILKTDFINPLDESSVEISLLDKSQENIVLRNNEQIKKNRHLLESNLKKYLIGLY